MADFDTGFHTSRSASGRDDRFDELLIGRFCRSANLTTDLAGKAASVHTHAESDVTGLVTDLAAKAAKAGDTFTGTLRVAGDQAYFECGPYQTVGGAFENMAKYSEDFSVGTWDKNGGSCSVNHCPRPQRPNSSPEP